MKIISIQLSIIIGLLISLYITIRQDNNKIIFNQKQILKNDSLKIKLLEDVKFNVECVE